MTFVELTREDGAMMMLNIKDITCIEENGEGTIITAGGMRFNIKEDCFTARRVIFNTLHFMGEN